MPRSAGIQEYKKAAREIGFSVNSKKKDDSIEVKRASDGFFVLLNNQVAKHKQVIARLKKLGYCATDWKL